ncbi:hypothetical protein VTN00DRAFT_2407 [Thermoascus crustaceus]|uniref:uncharacterized protein n=1 Tax=Thermoascus crustaceus TaxID=5088 RepID=UPI003743B6B3
MAGLTLAYKIEHEQKLGAFVDFTIYERQDDVGGTWLANRYPGLTCDVPIHIYTLPWCPKHDWSSFMAPGPEIRQYIRDASEKFDLVKFVRFNSKVISATWNDDVGRWDLEIQRNGEIIYDSCEVLVGAVGTQNTPFEPQIPGLSKFQGKFVHTGDWDDGLDCKDKRIAVIGNGSSGIQCFGALQKEAKSIVHYIRGPTWISMNYLAQFTKDGSNFAYSPKEKESFKDPTALLAYRQRLESLANGIFKNLVFQDTCQDVKKEFRASVEKLMKERLASHPELHGRLIPQYEPWCRRLTPGDDYLAAIQQPNAKLVDTPIESVTSTGLRTADGHTEEFDIIIAATGFVNSRVVPWTMTGLHGQTLASLWKDDVDGYLSVCAPSMPNYFSIGCGPNYTIANGSVLSSFGFVSDYVLKWARKIATEDIRSIVPRDDVIKQYNIYLQEVLRRTAWNGDCKSWYRKGRTNQYRTGITAIYPGSLMHFRSMLEEIRGEDFDIKYRSPNRFRFYGNGLTDLDMTDGADLAFYLQDTFRKENMLAPWWSSEDRNTLAGAGDRPGTTATSPQPDKQIQDGKHTSQPIVWSPVSLAPHPPGTPDHLSGNQMQAENQPSSLRDDL